jgi:hypothetical protein
MEGLTGDAFIVGPFVLFSDESEDLDVGVMFQF